MALAAPIRILLVEDNEVFREALELLLGLRSDIEVVASVGDGTEAVPACVDHRPDVVLMDFRLPGIDGVQATAALRKDQELEEIVAAIQRAAGRLAA